MFLTCEYLLALWHSEKVLKPVSRYVVGAGVFEPEVIEFIGTNTLTFSKEWSNFWEDPETDDYKSVVINLAYAIKFTRMGIRALLGKNGKGVILVMGSIAGQTSNFTGPLYVVTKYVISGFVWSIALLDKYSGIKVVCSAPGYDLT